MPFSPPMLFRWHWSISPSALKASTIACRIHAPQGAGARANSISCRRAWDSCWWRWALDARRKRRRRLEAWHAIAELAATPPVAHICKPAKRRASGTCASRLSARWCLFPASRIAGRAGKTRRFRRKSWRLSAQHHRADDGVRLSRPLYGHYGQGCVHMRINFDFRSEEGLRKFREFIDRAADVVLDFGGSLSGEHGDGQARAALAAEDVRAGTDAPSASSRRCGIRTTA